MGTVCKRALATFTQSYFTNKSANHLKYVELLTFGSVTVTVEASVWYNLIEPCVLGCDFLCRHKCRIELSEGCIELKDIRIPKIVSHLAVSLCTTVGISGRAEIICNVSDDERLIELYSRCWNKYVCLVGHYCG